MAIILNTYQFANDDGTVASALVSTGTNTLGMAARLVRGAPRSVALPFPDVETIQGEVYQFVFAFGYTSGTPTQYPGIYGAVHVRIFDGSGTLLEWDASATNPTRATTPGLVGDDNLSAFTSILTPSQTPVANARGVNLSSFGLFDSSRYVAAQSNPASKKMTAHRSTSGNGNFYWFIYSDPFSMYIPDNAFVEAQVTKLLDNTNPQSFVELALYNSAGGPMTLAQFGGTRTAPNIRGTTPLDQSYTASPIATVATLSAGFYYQSSDGTWTRINDFSTVGGTINDRVVNFDSNGDHDVYGYNVNCSGIAIFTKLVVVSSGLMSPFLVHPNGFCVAAIQVGTDTQIVTYSDTLADKQVTCTIPNIRPLSLERREDDGSIMLGAVNSSGAFTYLSTDDGGTFTAMAQAFDSTYETYFFETLFGGGAGVVATKTSSIKFKFSADGGTNWGSEVTVGTQPGGMKGLIIRQHYTNGKDRLTITDSATCRFDSTDGGVTWAAV